MCVGEIIKTDSLPKVNYESVNPITFLLKLRYGTVLIQLTGALLQDGIPVESHFFLPQLTRQFSGINSQL